VRPHEHELLLPDTDPCGLAERWGVALDTIRRVWLSALDFQQETGRPVWIISGYRTKAEQRELNRRGRPTALDTLSTHRTCPATGVDISFGVNSTDFMRATWGRITLINGLRWGGGGPVDPKTFIPVDWQHVDSGPRR